MNKTTLDTSLQVQPIPAIAELLVTLVHRIQKINQAITLIMSYIPDEYILKKTVINEALSLLTDIHQIELSPEHASVRDISQLSVRLRHVDDLLHIAHRGNHISEMNHTILSQELHTITQFIEEKIMTYCVGDVTYPFRIPVSDNNGMGTDIDMKDIMGIPEPVVKKTLTSDHDIKKTLPESVSEKTNIPTSVHQPFPKMTTPTEIKDRQVTTSIGHAPQPIKSTLTMALSPQKPLIGEDKKERRDAIMRTIRSKGQVTIRDISENINGCSEKTIQRDLQELIQHGVLMREGEKRWAVYKLAMKNV
jgi:hypothetical protein